MDSLAQGHGVHKRFTGDPVRMYASHPFRVGDWSVGADCCTDRCISGKYPYGCLLRKIFICTCLDTLGEIAPSVCAYCLGLSLYLIQE